jgi:hypothetical protein
MARPSRITATPGATTFEGPAAVALYKLIVLKSALALEGKGIKVWRHFSALKASQTETGLQTRDRTQLAAALEVKIAALRQQCEIR